MKSKKTSCQIKSLEKKIQLLSREIETLKSASHETPYAVESLLRLRGLKVFRKNPEDRLFFPPDLPPLRRSVFFERMKRYSFRLVLRDMIKHPALFHAQDLTHYCSKKVVQGYCDLLHQIGLIKKTRNGGYGTRVSPLFSFGPTLEWFVAEMFSKEFASPALYSVTLKETAAGGDFDVVASWNRRLVYVEVKSSPPRGIEQSEITTFFSRLEDLLPEVAILFNDTQLRMKDKLVPMFEEELRRRYGRRSKTLYPVNRLVDELFHVRSHIFIINSKKDIFENFSICLRHYLKSSEQACDSGAHLAL